MKILYLAPNRVILEAENDSDRAMLPRISDWLTGVNEDGLLVLLEEWGKDKGELYV
jgi:hypothetical protein